VTRVLLVGFIAAASVLWISVFGYLLLLRRFARCREVRGDERLEWPAIAVVVPVRDEAVRVVDKLDDLRRTDYPPDRLAVVFVDGGSSDGTAEKIQARIDGGDPVVLMRVPDARGKSEQINHVVRNLPQDILVVTDVDSALAPRCIRELVASLIRDPLTAVVGAVVHPDTSLVEERLHWRLLGTLWWLEGEALSAAVVSGVCYAVRRSAIPVLPSRSGAEDIHLTMAAAAGGHRVRICPTAHATEVRVPRSLAELIRYRRRRGEAYVRALGSTSPDRGSPLGCRVARLVRLWHFRVSPKISLVLVLVGAGLLWTPHWPWVVAAAAAFAVSIAAALRDPGSELSWCRRAVAASRLAGLTWYAVLTLPRQTGESS
jgi:cellulose synthase/poly-beta-1,6-N-acetylglucosamine synthase-like glycosyltransferase